MDVEPKHPYSPVLKIPAYEFPLRRSFADIGKDQRVEIRNFYIMRTEGGEVFYSEEGFTPDPSVFECIEQHETGIDVLKLARGIFDVEMSTEAMMWAEVEGWSDGRTPRPDTAPGSRLRHVLDVMWRTERDHKREDCIKRATEIARQMQNHTRFPSRH